MHKIEKSNYVSRVASFTATLSALVCLASCSTSEYHRQADSENYEILRRVEAQVFGRTNEFSIDTRYSAREPKEVEPSEIIRERMVGGDLRLTLDDALEIAFENSRNFQREKENLYLSALALSDRQNVFGSIWSGSSNPDIERDSSGDVKFQTRQRSSLGISKRVFQTGGVVTAQLANDILRFFTGSPRRSVVNTLSLSLTQPLLRGAGQYNTLANNLTQAERNVIYQIREFTQFQKGFAVDVVSDYLDLLGRKNTIRNNYANYLSRQIATLRAEKRIPTDGQQPYFLARQAELRQKNTYIDSVITYQRVLDDFKDRLAIPLSISIYLDDKPFDLLESTGMADVEFDAGTAYRLAIERHLPTLNEIDRFEDAKRRILVAANALRPGLDISGSAGLASNAPDNYWEFNADNVRANMGLVIDLPLNRVNQRNAYRSALIDFERQIRSLGQTLDNRRDVINQGLRTLRQRRLNYENNRLGVEIAERRVNEQKMLLEAGRSDQQTLIFAQNDLVDQQNSRVSAIVAFQQTLLQLLVDMGVINSQAPNFWLRPQYDTQPTEAAPLVSNELPAPDLSVSTNQIMSPLQLFQEGPQP
ncbi:MAG: TolC family protein [Verrucomicrobiae bacterium]|jgi:hypothetical protein|nr:TolC family protein [Verrucomicrobiae bacterium]